MLPADLTAIITAVAALHLELDVTTAVITALTPLLNSGYADELAPSRRAHRRRDDRARKRARARGAARPRHYQRKAPSPGREAALAAWRQNPEATPTEIAKAAKISRSTAVNAHRHFLRETRRATRRAKKTEAVKTETAKPAPHVTDRRMRAQRFLQETLAHGPKEVQAVEAAAAKARIDDTVLAQARGDLGVIATRADSGGHAVQWSLPG